MSKNFLFFITMSLLGLITSIDAVKLIFDYDSQSNITQKVSFSVCPYDIPLQGIESCNISLQTTNPIGLGEKAIIKGDYSANDLNKKIIANVEELGIYVINKSFQEAEIYSGSITINFPGDFKLLK